jgi:hypothetical protein
MVLCNLRLTFSLAQNIIFTLSLNTLQKEGVAESLLVKRGRREDGKFYYFF